MSFLPLFSSLSSLMNQVSNATLQDPEYGTSIDWLEEQNSERLVDSYTIKDKPFHPIGGMSIAEFKQIEHRG